MTDDASPPVYLGRYRTIGPGGRQGSRKIVIPAKAPQVAMYDVYLDDNGSLVLVPVVLKTVAPIIETEG